MQLARSPPEPQSFFEVYVLALAQPVSEVRIKYSVRPDLFCLLEINLRPVYKNWYYSY